MPRQYFEYSAALILGAAVFLSGCSKSPTAPSPTPTAAPTPAPPARSPAETFSTTTVAVTSDPLHSVGQGRTLRLGLDNATFDPIVSHNGGRLFMEIRQRDARIAWGFHLLTPNFGATPITAGTYDTSGDPLRPSLVFDFFGDGRGCSSTARLVIHAVELTPDRTALNHLRASFANHHCNGASPAMQGEIAILADPWR